jgi:hypothetical protein
MGSITKCDKCNSVILGKNQPQRGQLACYSYVPSLMVAMIVLSECFTTSSTLRPVLSACSPFAGSPGIGASEPIEPETSITQQMSNGALFAGESLMELLGCLGGLRLIRSLCDLRSVERETATIAAVGSTTVDIDETEVAGLLICMVVGDQRRCEA